MSSLQYRGLGTTYSDPTPTNGGGALIDAGGVRPPKPGMVPLDTTASPGPPITEISPAPQPPIITTQQSVAAQPQSQSQTNWLPWIAGGIIVFLLLKK